MSEKEWNPKPCPFCGSDDIWKRYNYARYSYMAYIECGMCGARTRAASINKEVPADETIWDHFVFTRLTDLWNMRKIPPRGDRPTDEQREAEKWDD